MIVCLFVAFDTYSATISVRSAPLHICQIEVSCGFFAAKNCKLKSFAAKKSKQRFFAAKYCKLRFLQPIFLVIFHYHQPQEFPSRHTCFSIDYLLSPFLILEVFGVVTSIWDIFSVVISIFAKNKVIWSNLKSKFSQKT